MLELLNKLFNSMSGLKVGDIDIADQVVDNEFKIKLLTNVVNWMITHGGQGPPQEMMTQWQNEIVEELQRKYPNSGIRYNEEKR